MSNATAKIIDTGLKKREIAYEQFSDMLLNLQIKPGQFLTQRELVKITDMPLGAIRELIPRLEADGLIKTIPQRGLQVTYIDMNLIRNAYELRQILETRAASQFARNATKTQIAELRNTHEDILEQANSKISDALVAHAQQTDFQFHETIIDALDNELISNIYRVNSIKVRLIKASRSRLGPNDVNRVINEHLLVIEAMEQRDEEGAGKAIRDHILGAKARAFAD